MSASPAKSGGERRAIVSRQAWILRWMGRGLVGSGLLLCLIPVAYYYYGSWQENQLTQRWQQELSAQPHSSAPVLTRGANSRSPVPDPPPTVPRGDIAFAIRVAKINYYAAVREGVTDDVLYAGPGHYPSSGWPGYPGTVGLAAHNTYWIQFGNLKAGDQIVIETKKGNVTYRITGRRVVEPTDLSVLKTIAGEHHLVLTTCWPLWAGALAHQRLAIFADQV
ncbi:MAG: class D sortase [Candidatus Dormibacteraceae bacterium]